MQYVILNLLLLMVYGLLYGIAIISKLLFSLLFNELNLVNEAIKDDNFKNVIIRLEVEEYNLKAIECYKKNNYSFMEYKEMYKIK